MTEVKPVIKGPINGNIFTILGAAQRLLKQNKQPSSEMVRKVMQAHTYNEALNIIMEYVEIDLND